MLATGLRPIRGSLPVVRDTHDGVYEFVVLAVGFGEVGGVLQGRQVDVEVRGVHEVGQTMQRGRLKLRTSVPVLVRLLLGLELLRLQTNMVCALFSETDTTFIFKGYQTNTLNLPPVILNVHIADITDRFSI